MNDMVSVGIALFLVFIALVSVFRGGKARRDGVEHAV